MRPSEILRAELPTPVDRIIEARAATAFFDPRFVLSDSQIRRLAVLATRAPSAYNLQNWRLDAVQTAPMKSRLRAAAWDQAKIEDAAVTFVISGETARADELGPRLAPSVEAGLMSGDTAVLWSEMATGDFAARPRRARDEAIRSATLLAATLMYAAEGHGLATAPMSGFDPRRVRRLLGLSAGTLPVLLLAVGRPGPGNRSQKPRRPVSDVLNLH